MKNNSNMKIAPILNQLDHILPEMHQNSFTQSKQQKKEGDAKENNQEIIRVQLGFEKQFKYDAYNKQKQQAGSLKLNTVLIKVQKKESKKNKNRKNQQKCEVMVPNVQLIQKQLEVQDEDRKQHKSSNQSNQPIVQIRPRSKNLSKKQFHTAKDSTGKKRQKKKEEHKIQKNNEKTSNMQKTQFVSSSEKNGQVHQRMKSEIKKNENKRIDCLITKRKDPKSGEYKMRKKQSFTSTNQILDSRKKSESSSINRNLSICERFQHLKIPKERILSFLLIYQILLTFILLFCLIQNIYSMLPMILVLIIPTYFGHQCISSRIDETKINEQTVDPSSQDAEDNKKCRENRNICNSYLENLEQSELTQQNYSITSLNIQTKSKNGGFKQEQKLYQDSINESNAKAIFPLSNSYSETNSIINQKAINFILVVPYLQQNQVQNFIKCSKCKSTHTNSRIKHCNSCNVCHFGYDHYCKWLAVCIDGANYLYFLRFLSSVWILGILFNILGIFYITKISKELQLRNQSQVEIIYLVILCFVEIQNILAFAFSTYVLGYHLWLIQRGVSTRQHFLSQGKVRRHNTYCTTSSSTFFKSFFHLLNNTYLLFFIQKFPKQGRMLRQKNLDESLTKSIFTNQERLKKEEKNNSSQQNSSQKTNQQIEQQLNQQQGHYHSASEAGSPVKLSFRNFMR